MYDYIIVGAGSAGSVLASRLTEDPATTVLLLEAGGPDKAQEIHIPAAFPKLLKGAHDWAYFTEPQPHLNNRKLYWPRGKVLGGSSSLNAMIYIRGNKRDYDEWQAQGNEEWGYTDVLPYFKRAENQERGASAYHSVGGPLNVADQRSPNPLSRAFVEAGAHIGLPRNNDFNGQTQDGVGLYQVTQKQGQRYSAAKAYLTPALARPNLTVKTHTHATRLLLDGSRVTGVAFTENDQPTEASASREVLLCGGAINSPQLLMLSGIGPADHLKEMAIPVAVDLPGVGQNLQDHPAIFVAYTSTKPLSLASAEKPQHIVNFLLRKRGMLTSNIGEGGAFVRSRPDLPEPDIQFHFAPAYFIEHGFQRPDGHGFTFGPTLVRPESRGYITLHSRDPFASPAIQPNYFAADADIQALLAGIKLSRQLAQDSAFDPFRGPEFAPGAQVTSDADLIAFIRANAETLYHPVGTCKMGHDPLSVVDDALRVHGVTGLRVVDASIMPTIVAGNTNAPTIMIAEKAADMIKEDARSARSVRAATATT